jgi:4-amino-4-deoxy-L-arabinose transferase-like glycosyltransferase
MGRRLALGVGSPYGRDGCAVAGLALAVRLLVVAWAASRFPPAADGTYYHRLAERIAAGLGSTWLWPDGAVTFAAHYPVGYPALIGAAYAVFGPHPAAAMVLNAVIGSLAAVAVHQLAARAGSRTQAGIAGVLVALHPGLVAYTPAIMTEGVAAAFIACGAWAAAWAREGRPASGPEWLRFSLARTVVIGLVAGAGTLLRPQLIVLAPLLAFLSVTGAARGTFRRRLAAAFVATAAAVLVCAPWTLRNCVRMHRCALVSVNGGWNLLIGADAESTGTWAPIKVPAACREVFDEAQKDECFSREAQGYIAGHPGAWLSLIPNKLAATFDYSGAAGSYLYESNRHACGDRCKRALGTTELIYERSILLLALIWAGTGGSRGGAGRSRGSFRAKLGAWAPFVVAVAGAVTLFFVHAWVAYLAFAIAVLLRAREVVRGPVLGAAAVAVLLSTALTHAVFFGGGRYSLVVFPLLSGVAALAAPWRPRREAQPSLGAGCREL